LLLQRLGKLAPTCFEFILQIGLGVNELLRSGSKKSTTPTPIRLHLSDEGPERLPIEFRM
jgi:hypothetical protein